MAAQAKDATTEKGQKGYFPAKDTISSVAKTAVDYTAPVAERAKDYTIKTKELAKSAGSTTASYIGEKGGQAKDVTAETSKSAAGKAGKVAVDLKDKVTAAGWAAAHYPVEKTVEGTKAAAHAVEGAPGHAGHKATEIAAKSLGPVKGLAAQAGETVVEYTAKKKEETQHELEAKRPTHQQGEEGKQSGLGRQQQQHKGEQKGGIGETLGQLAEKIKPFDTDRQQKGEEQRQEREGFEIGQSEENYERRQQEENGNGVLGAIKETLVEIAETTKSLVIGDQDETKVRQKMGSEGGRVQGYSKYDEYGH